ncbi:hypothetical protein EIN_383020 [Entamoeba invadens IP1]|uniref:Uncharacterized protein n=1 Tax=Entamoeba invadens IP1 TaxID=370355 RepID=A0A0A1U6V5_ENTIV|nr:hypothetical protein EIN_383020 [Entamoeba invadens IP1]ELP87688.1 hypothetical protein EIN_383020 [Entamoeba invadens IP1]|eukprot:XP_004254459.1 hypothetical protein EIN_383020 [Entamoeba invadens IP1]
MIHHCLKKLATVKVSIFIEKTAVREILKKDFNVAILMLRQQNVEVFDCEENVVDHCSFLDNLRYVGDVAVTNVKGIDSVYFQSDNEIVIEDQFGNDGYDKWIEIIKQNINKNTREHVEQDKLLIKDQNTPIQNDLIKQEEKNSTQNVNVNSENYDNKNEKKIQYKLKVQMNTWNNEKGVQRKMYRVMNFKL